MPSLRAAHLSYIEAHAAEAIADFGGVSVVVEAGERDEGHALRVPEKITDLGLGMIEVAVTVDHRR